MILCYRKWNLASNVSNGNYAKQTGAFPYFMFFMYWLSHKGEDV